MPPAQPGTDAFDDMIRHHFWQIVVVEARADMIRDAAFGRFASNLIPSSPALGAG
jgi:hypothetical protein